MGLSSIWSSRKLSQQDLCPLTTPGAHPSAQASAREASADHRLLQAAWELSVVLRVGTRWSAGQQLLEGHRPVSGMQELSMVLTAVGCL